MKLAIAYDGSKDAEAAIDDLAACGLPEGGSAQVVSIAEVWLPPAGAIDDDPAEGASDYFNQAVHEARQRAERAVIEAEMLAKFGTDRVKLALPGWNVVSVASHGSPGWEIVSQAEAFGADLILVGAQGRSFLGRLALGSISQRVLTEANCSVRIGRGRIDLDRGPQRIVIGFDGSRGAKGAAASVASREWSPGTEVLLVAVTEPALPTAIGRFVSPGPATVGETSSVGHIWLERTAEAVLKMLRAAHLGASFTLCGGEPKRTLIDEAEKWGADCIFLGASAWGSRVERLLLGSTAAAVAARAHCSVEVVRSDPRFLRGVTPHNGVVEDRTDRHGRVER